MEVDQVMPRRKSVVLTETEIKLMDILWMKGEGTVHDIVNILSEKEPVAYTTVLTILRILETKGYLKHRKVSHAFVYYPVVERADARRNAIQDVIRKFFDNSPELLVLNILDNDQIKADELSRLREMIEKNIEVKR
jgi:predicted transcriptional regulator